MMILSEAVDQRYKYKSNGKSPTEIQHELEKMGVKGFVVKVTPNKVVMKVEQSNRIKNRKCLNAKL